MRLRLRTARAPDGHPDDEFAEGVLAAINAIRSSLDHLETAVRIHFECWGPARKRLPGRAEVLTLVPSKPAEPA